MTTYSITQAKTHLSTAIDAALAGKQTVITRHGKPVAKIVPYEEVSSDLSIFDQHRSTLAKGFKFDHDELNARG